MGQLDFEDSTGTSNAVGGVPLLNTRQKQYWFVRQTVKGDGGYIDGTFLFPHLREDQLSYDARRKQNFLRNYLSGVVDSVIKPVFSSQAKRIVEDGNKIAEEFTKNCDNKRGKLQSYTKKVLTELVSNSIYFTIIDNFEELPKLEVDQIKNRAFPYIYGRTGDMVIQYKLDDFDNILSITFLYKREKIVRKNGGEVETDILIEYNKDKTTIYYMDGKEKIILKESDNLLKDENGNSIIPVIRFVFDDEDEEFLPKPRMFDLARLQLSIYQQDSEQRSCERQSAFVMLQIPTDDDLEELEVGSSNIITIDPDSNNEASFIAPPPENLRVIQESAKEYVASFAEQANNVGSTPIRTGDVKSGVALAYEFLGQSYALLDVATKAEEVEEEIIKYLSYYLKKDIEYEVEYNDNFAPTFSEIEKKITVILSILSDAGVSGAVKSSAEYDLAKLLIEIGRYDDDRAKLLLEKVSAEINSI